MSPIEPALRNLEIFTSTSVRPAVNCLERINQSGPDFLLGSEGRGE
ncbi:MAG: hypothetical protein K1X29_00755 [Bdellovibrionales bacterium]|nr:hypothetical protein [Bdellovibrionales bacterium]